MIVLCDFSQIYYNLKREETIEKERCSKDFYENNCNNLLLKDGTELRDYCMKKKKCMELDSVNFSAVVINYIRTLLENGFRGLGFFQCCFIIFFIFIFVKSVLTIVFN
ncbi:MAG: Brr6/Brl1 family protein [archaeon]|nr:Brr6/Brl1 family protein [archaeon]